MSNLVQELVEFENQLNGSLFTISQRWNTSFKQKGIVCPVVRVPNSIVVAKQVTVDHKVCSLAKPDTVLGAKVVNKQTQKSCHVWKLLLFNPDLDPINLCILLERYFWFNLYWLFAQL